MPDARADTAHVQLRDLQTLNLSLNGLEDIPIELGALSKLVSLNLNDNRLKTLPGVVCTH